MLIRKIKYRESDNRPTMYLQAHYNMFSALKGAYAELIKTPGKGIGRDARIARNERAFVKFLKANYGTGDFSVVLCKGGRTGFKRFWRGIIEKDRFKRLTGSISPYLLTISPVRAWHAINIKPEEII